jgi:hypothetical protein
MNRTPSRYPSTHCRIVVEPTAGFKRAGCDLSSISGFFERLRAIIRLPRARK